MTVFVAVRSALEKISRLNLMPVVLAAALLAGCQSTGEGTGASGPVLATPTPSTAGSEKPADNAAAIKAAEEKRLAEEAAAKAEQDRVAAEEQARLEAEAAAAALAAQANAPIRAAILLPLSGQHAGLGQALLNAASLAVFDAGAERFVLTSYDTLGTPEGAEAAAQQAIAAGARIILGPLFGASTSAVAPLAITTNIPVISFSNDEAVAGDGIMIMGFSPRTQVERVVVQAMGEGLTRFAALLPDDPYGRTVARHYSNIIQAMGAELDRVIYYHITDENLEGLVKGFADYDQRRYALRQEIAGLKGRTDAASIQTLARLEKLDTLGEPPYQALLLADTADALVRVAPLLPYYDVDPKLVRFMGTMLWATPGLEKEPSLQGGWYASPAPAARSSFRDRYRQAFDTAAPDIASLAYDATALAAVLARIQPENPYDLATLTSVDGFAGVDGLFRFRADGTVERGLAVIEFADGKRRVHAPAPVRFDPPLLN